MGYGMLGMLWKKSGCVDEDTEFQLKTPMLTECAEI